MTIRRALAIVMAALLACAAEAHIPTDPVHYLEWRSELLGAYEPQALDRALEAFCVGDGTWPQDQLVMAINVRSAKPALSAEFDRRLSEVRFHSGHHIKYDPYRHMVFPRVEALTRAEYAALIVEAVLRTEHRERVRRHLVKRLRPDQPADVRALLAILSKTTDPIVTATGVMKLHSGARHIPPSLDERYIGILLNAYDVSAPLESSTSRIGCVLHLQRRSCPSVQVALIQIMQTDRRRCDAKGWTPWSWDNEKLRAEFMDALGPPRDRDRADELSAKLRAKQLWRVIGEASQESLRRSRGADGSRR